LNGIGICSNGNITSTNSTNSSSSYKSQRSSLKRARRECLLFAKRGRDSDDGNDSDEESSC